MVDAAGAPPDRVLACIAPLTLRGPVVATAEGALTLQEPRRSVRVG
ncbi:MAG: hypothetical protein RML12_06980 [Xanthomonadales bacterium]|nr:hypothetical protein [Xanthomonadales bacterium]